jgi:hypothetical protein
MASAEGRHARNSICTNRSFGVLRTAGVDTREAAIALQATADLAECRAIHGRVMEAAARTQPLAMAEAAAPPVAVGIMAVEAADTPEAEAVVTRVAEVVVTPVAEAAVTPVEVDTAAIARPRKAELL